MADYNLYTDSELLSLASEGDEKAFTVLFEKYRSQLFYFILQHTKSWEISEEIVIDIFMKLWGDPGMIRDIKDPPAFFHKMAFYRAMDYLRTVARHNRLQHIYSKRLELQQAVTPDEIMIEAEEKQLLLNAVNQLPAQRKLVYLMSREEKLSHSQIAELLKISTSTVNNSIVSATRSITSYLKSHVSGKAALSIWYLMMALWRGL